MIKLNVCLSDLPKDKIREAKNGKKYIDLMLFEKRETGKFGETHNIAVSKSDKTEQTIYVGSGKTLRNGNQ